MTVKTLRVATRGSRLAMIQTEIAVRAIEAVYPNVSVKIITITTSGDTSQATNQPLQSVGGQGVFAKSLSIALEAGEVDFAVHSYKDLPARWPDKYTCAAILKRGAPEDCFLSNHQGVKTIADLPQGAIVGSSSPRRAAITLSQRPDLKIVTFRGNVDRRLQKLANRFENVDATFLAKAGLERMERFDPQNHHILSPDEMLPSAGQGAIAIEIMRHRTDLIDFFRPVGCLETTAHTAAEKAAIAVVDGECRTPVAAYAETMQDGKLRLRMRLYTIDGRECVTAEKIFSRSNALEAGAEAGQSILQQIGTGNHERFLVKCSGSDYNIKSLIEHRRKALTAAG